MTTLLFKGISLVLAGSLLAACASTDGTVANTNTAVQGKSASSSTLVAIPKNKDTDLRIFYPDGHVIKGKEAMDRMSQAKLTMWLAGNQFFAMEDVIHAFQKQNPGVSVGVITLPPGLILKAIQAGGWTYNGTSYPSQPDIYASVNLNHLKTLKKDGLMNQYAVYMHNELQIMVAKGNPKKITSVQDLVRPGVRTSMPNPVNEGIMQFYIKKVLQRHGVWDQISGGKECVHCQATPNSWFTAVHHRETPERIQDGRSDAGIVWKTEVQHAQAEGQNVEGVTLPPQDSLRNEVAYVIGILNKSPHQEEAMKYMRFLASPAAQDTYAKYGFVKASPDELTMKAVP